MMSVPDEGVAVTVEDLGRAVVSQPHPSLSVRPEPDRLAVLEVDPVFLVLADEVERTVIEDVAVLEDLDEGAPLVLSGSAQNLRQLSAIGVNRARDERRLGAECKRERVERPVERA